MNQEKDIGQELESSAPLLSKLEKKDTFSVPVNYFYKLPDQIQQRIQGKQRRFLFLPDIIYAPSFRLTLSLASLLIIALFIFNNKSGSILTRSTQPMTAEKYIMDNIEVNDITEYMSENPTNPEKHLKDQKKELEETVIENIDENLIIEEL